MCTGATQGAGAWLDADVASRGLSRANRTGVIQSRQLLWCNLQVIYHTPPGLQLRQTTRFI
jgi:hypothetical protein